MQKNSFSPNIHLFIDTLYYYITNLNNSIINVDVEISLCYASSLLGLHQESYTWVTLYLLINPTFLYEHRVDICFSIGVVYGYKQLRTEENFNIFLCHRPIEK